MDIRWQLKYLSHKFFWFFAGPIRKQYRFLVRPNGRAVKIVILDGKKILLARINYKHRLWTIPGGSVGKHESYEDAARREAWEELGIRLGTLTLVGEYIHTREYYNNTTKVFTAECADTTFTVDGIEIKEARWFPIYALPADRRLPNVDNVLRLAGLKI